MSNLVITVNRECGSGGREIARKLGEILGLKVYDRRILESVAEQFDITKEDMDQVMARKTNWWSDFCRFYQQFGAAASIDTVCPKPTPLSLYNAERKLMLNLAEQEPCIVVGRAGFNVFRDYPNARHVMILADRAARVKRISDKQHLSEDEANKLIDRIDKERETFTHTVANTSRYDARHYDMVLNVTGLESSDVAQFLAEVVRKKGLL